MPLPSVVNGAKQCQVLTRRGKKPCLNPAAFGCKACRMHGAHRSRNVLRGEDHPQYKNGRWTQESKRNYADASLRLRLLEEIGWHINMFAEGSTHTRGRKAQEQIILDYGNMAHLQITLALLKSK